MITFEAILHKFGEKGEKTGWIYIEIPIDLMQELNPDTKKIFRVKGKIDNFEIKQIALMPMGNGDFILPTNTEIRKGIHKSAGATVRAELEIDLDPPAFSEDLLACLADEPKALEHFESLTEGHRRYFSKWIESAKTHATKAKRISQAVQGLSMHMAYDEMIRYFKALNKPT